jgi:hypothetical protein
MLTQSRQISEYFKMEKEFQKSKEANIWHIRIEGKNDPIGDIVKRYPVYTH